MELLGQLSLSQRLQNLPFELHYMIIEKYKDMFIFPEITKRNKQTLEILRKEINGIDVEPEDLIDVSHICLFTRVFNQKNSERGQNFIYLNKCISGVIEYYFSLKYEERIIFKTSVLDDNTNIYNDYNRNNDNDCYIDNIKYKIRDNFTSFIFRNKHLTNLIDPDDCHSGSTGLWCVYNIIPIIFGSYEKRLEHWIKLIHGHFNLRLQNELNN